MPGATTEEEATADPDDILMCADHPWGQTGSSGGGLGRSSNMEFQDAAGNLPYANCQEYAQFTSVSGTGVWASLNRRTACMAGTNRVWVTRNDWTKWRGWVDYFGVFTMKIDPTNPLHFTVQADITLTDQSLFFGAKNHSLLYSTCDAFCWDTESSWQTKAGTGWAGVLDASFTGATPPASSSDWISAGSATAILKADSRLTGPFELEAAMPRWRCDDGRVFGGTTPGCVFPWAAGLVTYSQTALPKIYRHISLAIASGLPGGVGSGTYLHYLVDETAQDANRNIACPRANTTNGLTRPTVNGVDYQCDEYPFASVYEGAASSAEGPRSFDDCYMPDAPQTGDEGFSRCFVPWYENSSQGGIMGALYKRDQLLDGDPFQVLLAP